MFHALYINPILHEVFDQRILHEGGKMPPYLTSKLKVMKAPNFACGWFEKNILS